MGQNDHWYQFLELLVAVHSSPLEQILQDLYAWNIFIKAVMKLKLTNVMFYFLPVPLVEQYI